MTPQPGSLEGVQPVSETAGNGAISGTEDLLALHPSEVRRFRHGLLLLLSAFTLVAAAWLGVRIYELAHPRTVTVFCDTNPNNDQWEQEYKGSADLVLGACGVR